MKQRIITAIGIILVVALPVALGGLWLEALALFIVCASAYEWMHIQPDFKNGLNMSCHFVLWQSYSQESYPINTF